MNAKCFKITAAVVLFVVFSFSQAAGADSGVFSKLIFKDSIFILKLNAGALLSTQRSMEGQIPALKKAQEDIRAEIEKRTGMVFTRDIKELLVTVGPEIDFSAKNPNNFLLVLSGSFDAEKLCAEIGREKRIPVRVEKKNGRYHLLTDKGFQGVFLNENAFVFGSDDAVEKAAAGTLKSAEPAGETKKIFDESGFFLSISLTDRLKDDILKNMSGGTPPIATILLKSLRGLVFFDKYPAFVLRAEFSEPTAAADFKKLIDSFKNMAEVMITAREKEEDEKISKAAGAFELLKPERLGFKAGIGIAKTLIGALEASAEGGSAELKLRVPSEFQAFLKPGHLPILAGVTGIMAAIAVPNFSKAKEKAIEKNCNANMRTILAACEMYEMDNGMPAMITVMELVEKQYLKQKPVCRLLEKDGMEYKIIVNDRGFDVECPKHGKLSESLK